MIIDLHVNGRSALVVGAGAEALRRTETLLSGGCAVHIVAASDRTDGRLTSLAESGRITLETNRRIVSAADIIAARSPFIVVAATDDHALNAKMISEARAAGSLAYASDSPDKSDFANLSAISIGSDGGTARITVAVSTGGASPSVARDIRARIEPLVRSAVSPADVRMAGLHARLRPLVAERMAGAPHASRRAAVARVSADPALKQLLQDGREGEAWRRAAELLDAICDEPGGPGQR